MDNTLYILTRTSGRPVFFRHLRETVKALTWPGPVVHMVHTDDPRDTYVDGDIILRGESLADIPVKRRAGQYNLYNNRLLDAIPGDGWVHFMDDDDEYASPDVFERLLADADPEKVIVGHVQRGRGIIPPGWGTQKSFQTEIPVMRVSVARSSRWPATKGGDHFYNRPIVRRYGCQWVDNVLIATSREGKGNGQRNDMRGSQRIPHGLPGDHRVYVKPVLRDAWAPMTVTLKEAETMAKDVDLLITYEGVTAEYLSVPAPETPARFDADVVMAAGVRKSFTELIDDAEALGLGPREKLRKHGRAWLKHAIRKGTPDGYKQYRRVGIVRMRPYIEGESTDGIVTAGRVPQRGDYIARDLLDPNRLWLVPRDVHARYYRELEAV